MDGSLKGNFLSDLPEETCMDGGYIINRFLESVKIIDIQTFQVLKSFDTHINCIGRGNKLLLAIENKIVDIFFNTVLNVEENSIAVYSFSQYIFVGFSNKIEIFLNNNS